MPVHDWTRVRPGSFHDFHTSWITHLKERLNAGLLPAGYYAMAELPAGDVGPDVLTLEAPRLFPSPAGGVASDSAVERPQGVLSIADAPPRVAVTARAEMAGGALKRRTLVIRHSTGDRIVALVEILSAGNKQTRLQLQRFVDKALSALKQGYHLLVVDLYPPGPQDRSGIHGAIWSQLDDADYTAPPGKPLTLAAYAAGVVPVAYVEPVAVGAILPDMPLFLDSSWYINVPLESTYAEAYRGVPERWRRVIEGCDPR